MPITNKTIIDRVNDKIADPTTSVDDVNRLTTIAGLIRDSAVVSVDTENSLPDASLNIGRLIFVNSVKSYRYSDGNSWQLISNSIPAAKAVIWAWGRNSGVALGDNSSTNRSSPVSIVGAFTDWCQVSAGGDHTAAIRTNGTLWSWGSNGLGQLGDNTATNKSSPSNAVGNFTDWCNVSAGRLHTVAIRTNGTLWSWGSNSRNQLGHGTATTCNRSSPVSVVGGFTDWRQASASTYLTIALRTNGTLWSWGENINGELGDNTTVNKSSPVSVVGGFTDWCQVSAGGRHAAAIRTNGTLWTWGCNYQSQLGHNTASTCSRSSPVSVVGGFTDWCQVSAGGLHTAAIRTNGTLWTWGGNIYGSLGHNTSSATCSRSSPVSVVGGFTDWCQVSAGRNSTNAAIRTNGTLWTWGGNSDGQLGINSGGNGTQKSSPVSVVGGFTDWCQVSAGNSHIASIRFVR